MQESRSRSTRHIFLNFLVLKGENFLQISFVISQSRHTKLKKHQKRNVYSKGTLNLIKIEGAGHCNWEQYN